VMCLLYPLILLVITAMNTYTRVAWGFCCIFPINHLTPNGHFSGRTASLTYRCCIFLLIQQIHVLNILNMLHTLRFFLFKMSFISLCYLFWFYIIHILNTGCVKFKRKFRRQRVNNIRKFDICLKLFLHIHSFFTI
jgi:hypothetical protein